MKEKNKENAVCSSCEQKKKDQIDIKTILKSKIDIKEGKLTFGQRIELGKIFQSEVSEAEKLEQAFVCLHNYKPKPTEYKKLLDYFNEVLEGLIFWMGQESTLLKYEPSVEEITAGVRELSAKIGEFGTIKALAKAYGQDPDDILQWQYGKVFGILYTDLEEYKFQKAYNKVLEKKYK